MTVKYNLPPGRMPQGLVQVKPFNPAASAYFAAVTAAGGTISPARQLIYNTLFTQLAAAGAQPFMCSLPILAAENTQSALVDLITLQTMTPVNAPTFTADQGYAGNGTNSYVNTNYTAASPYTTNVATIGVYTRTNRTAGQPYANFGADALDSGGPTTQMFPVYTDGKAYSYVNGSVFAGVPSSPNAQGNWMVVRTGATATSLRRNQVQLAAENDLAIGPPLHSFFIGACPDNTGIATNFSTDQNAAAVVGAFPTIVMADAVAAAINGYMTAIGANVY